MRKTYDLNRATNVCREIWDGEGNKKAWNDWQQEFEGTDSYSAFLSNNRNYNLDWREWLNEQ